MSIQFKASKRDVQGSGASRRLRRAGQVPGIIYGAGNEPQLVALDHNELYYLLQKEAFHSSLLSMNLDGTEQIVVLRDVQWHPYRQLVLHIDFQRVDATHKIHMRVPLHFINGDMAPGVKDDGGVIAHVHTELEISCLPAQLPEHIVVDLKDLGLGESVHLGAVSLPEGVEVLHADAETVIATVQVPQTGSDEEEAPAEAAAPAEGAAPAAGGEA